METQKFQADSSIFKTMFQNICFSLSARLAVYPGLLNICSVKTLSGAMT